MIVWSVAIDSYMDLPFWSDHKRVLIYQMGFLSMYDPALTCHVLISEGYWKILTVNIWILIGSGLILNGYILISNHQRWTSNGHDLVLPDHVRILNCHDLVSNHQRWISIGNVLAWTDDFRISIGYCLIVTACIRISYED